MTLRDNTAPTAANVSGDLIASPEWRGPMSLAFSAADTGSGVYRIIVSVDGQDALGVVVDANDGRCADADATNADAHEFLWPVPCKASVAPQLAVDTGGLPLGAHAVSLLLEDAAGNRTPIYGPVAKTILAPPAGRGEANGTPASDAARFTGPPPSHGHDLVRATAGCASAGRLVGPDGKPIAGARIDVLSQLHRAGARFRDHRARAHQPQGRLQLQGTAGRVADAALRLPLAPRRRRLHRHARRAAARARRAPPCARAAASSRAAAG